MLQKQLFYRYSIGFIHLTTTNRDSIYKLKRGKLSTILSAERTYVFNRIYNMMTQQICRSIQNPIYFPLNVFPEFAEFNEK